MQELAAKEGSRATMLHVDASEALLSFRRELCSVTTGCIALELAGLLRQEEEHGSALWAREEHRLVRDETTARKKASLFTRSRAMRKSSHSTGCKSLSHENPRERGSGRASYTMMSRGSWGRGSWLENHSLRARAAEWLPLHLNPPRRDTLLAAGTSPRLFRKSPRSGSTHHSTMEPESKAPNIM